ncbi:MAG: butyrate kinase [Oscillospiraceae bacterium]|jgi:butyrate kinase|nr:butyrate kinase [Oscillospiraceae bacterium]
MKFKILAINPGSTSTKIALFEDETALFSESVSHPGEELRGFAEIQEQLDYRAETVAKTVAAHGFRLEDVDVFSGRGGGLLPLAGGTYEVTPLLALHASRGMTGQHPAQLASQICKRFADLYGGRAFVVNPPDVDEFDEVSRVAGVKGIYRESHVHALNQKEIAIRFCAARGLKYEAVNLVICHLGGGISITAHRRGRMIDSNDIIKGSGPMTPTRAGDLPYARVLDLAYSGEFTKKELTDKLNKNGGLTDIFGTADVRDVKALAARGSHYAAAVYDGMIYQCAKYAGAMSAALKGDVDAILLTGGIANDPIFTARMVEYLGWIAEVAVLPGEFELEALAAGALRVLRGEEAAREYTGIPVWRGFEDA